jgi:hypothetical protein
MSAQHGENFFIPNSLWGMPLTVWTVVRKSYAITQILAKGYFWRNASSYGPKVKSRLSAWKSSLQERSQPLNLFSQIFI